MKTDIDTCNLISDRGWELEKYVIRKEKVKKSVRKIQVQNTAILKNTKNRDIWGRVQNKSPF